jgi:putative membrane protein
MTTATDRSFVLFNASVSALGLAFLGWLLFLHGGIGTSAVDLRFMPAVNAGLNALSACLLVAAFVAIKRGNRGLHQRLNVSAFASSALFLVGYVAYHYVHGDTRYVGAHRGLYLSILASHILLSLSLLPLVLTTFYLAANERFAAHRKVARVLLPIWLYVSVTGVLIFFFLRGSVPASP